MQWIPPRLKEKWRFFARRLNPTSVIVAWWRKCWRNIGLRKATRSKSSTWAPPSQCLAKNEPVKAMRDLILSDITVMGPGYCVIGLERVAQDAFRSVRPLPPRSYAWPSDISLRTGKYGSLYPGSDFCFAAPP